jgi:hypothetical protein
LKKEIADGHIAAPMMEEDGEDEQAGQLRKWTEQNQEKLQCVEENKAKAVEMLRRKEMFPILKISGNRLYTAPAVYY